jgi:hypothetical protein
MHTVRRAFAAATLAAACTACAGAAAPPSDAVRSGALQTGLAASDERAAVLGGVIRMRTRLFGTTQLADACDVRRLLDDDSRFRERLRFDARPGVSPGAADDCATRHPGNTWRILGMEPVKPGHFRVRVDVYRDATSHDEDYMATADGVYDIRIYNFTYD